MNKVALQAFQAYDKVNSKNFGSGFDSIPGEAISFRNLVQNNFNSYATMKPEEILSRIKTQGVNSYKQSDIITQAISAIKEPVQTSQIVMKKALLGEASILELSTSTARAKNTVKTMVAFRDQFSQQWDKIFNMQL